MSILRLPADPGFERLLLDTTQRQAATPLYEAFGSVETHRESTPADQMALCETALGE